MTTKELAEWLENVVTVEKMGSTALHLTQWGRDACKERAEMFAAAARRLAVLEEEVEVWRRWERQLWRDLEGIASPRPPFTAGPTRDLSEARAATDKERANG